MKVPIDLLFLYAVLDRRKSLLPGARFLTSHGTLLIPMESASIVTRPTLSEFLPGTLFSV